MSRDFRSPPDTPERFSAIRSQARGIADKMVNGEYDFEITEADIRLLLIMRASEYARLTIVVKDGSPVKVDRMEEEIDLARTIDFQFFNGTPLQKVQKPV